MYELINFTVHGDYEGNLVPLETGGEIPFDVKRVYYIWGTKRTAVRGHHTHRRLEQAIVCISGSCDFILNDSNKSEKCPLHPLTRMTISMPETSKCAGKDGDVSTNSISSPISSIFPLCS